jgi:hypothetical protein
MPFSWFQILLKEQRLLRPYLQKLCQTASDATATYLHLIQYFEANVQSINPPAEVHCGIDKIQVFAHLIAPFLKMIRHDCACGAFKRSSMTLGSLSLSCVCGPLSPSAVPRSDAPTTEAQVVRSIRMPTGAHVLFAENQQTLFSLVEGCNGKIVFDSVPKNRLMVMGKPHRLLLRPPHSKSSSARLPRLGGSAARYDGYWRGSSKA